MTEIHPFKEGHLDFMKLRDIYAGDKQCRERAVHLSKADKSAAWTIVCNGEVICVFGFIVVWDGFAEIWSLTTDKVAKYPKEFFRTSKRLLEYYINKFSSKRVQVAVLTDFPEGIRWVEHLGFEREGLMRKFGPDGKDYFLYARVLCQ